MSDGDSSVDDGHLGELIAFIVGIDIVFKSLDRAIEISGATERYINMARR